MRIEVAIYAWGVYRGTIPIFADESKNPPHEAFADITTLCEANIKAIEGDPTILDGLIIREADGPIGISKPTQNNQPKKAPQCVED